MKFVFDYDDTWAELPNRELTVNIECVTVL